jgi:hypothetical protein
MESDDIKETDSELQAALDEATAALQGIADSSTVIGSSDEKFALAAAGFCEGYEMHRTVSSNDRGPDTQTLDALRGAIRAMSAVVDPSPELTLAATRLQTRLDAIHTSFMGAYYQSVEHQFGASARVIAEKSEITDDEAHEFASVVFRGRTADFFGFVWANDDPKIKCRCPSHFVEAFANANVTEMQLREKMLKQFGSHAVAFTRFGHWFHTELNRLARERLGAEPEAIGEEAREAGHSFITSIMQKGRGES